MALLRCDFFSEALEVATSMTVLLPQAGEAQIGVSAEASERPPPTLYLLHGLSDDATAWTRYTSIERYAAEHGLAVVMPTVGRSFYADEVHGHRYWTFLSQELPEIVRSFFRVSQEPADTFVAGLSMGGYGALKWALHQPERFAATASLSGALEPEVSSDQENRDALLDRVFGGRTSDEDRLLALLDRANTTTLPLLYVGCGTDDRLFEVGRRFAAAAGAAGWEPTVDWRPGSHEWPVWDAMIRDVLAWLPLRR